MHRSVSIFIALAGTLAGALPPLAARAGEPPVAASTAPTTATATGETATAAVAASAAPALAASPALTTATGPGSTAAAATAELLPPPPPPPPEDEPYPHWGVFLGAGVPQAAQISIVYRPVPLIRIDAGPSYDYLGFGVHAGVTLTPIRWAITPTLGGEVGQFSTFDVTKIATSVDAKVAPLLKRVSVRYAAALLGFEIGSQRGFNFVLRVGLTYLEIDSRGSATFDGIGITTGSTQSTGSAVVTDPKIRGTAPTAQLGFQYFF